MKIKTWRRFTQVDGYPKIYNIPSQEFAQVPPEMEGEPWNDLPLTFLFMPTAHKNSSPALQGQNSGTNDLIKQEISWLTATKKTKMQWNDAEFERGCKAKPIERTGFAFFLFDMCIPNAVGAQTMSMTAVLNHFYLWSNQDVLYPPLTCCIFFKMWLCSTLNASSWHIVSACLC